MAINGYALVSTQQQSLDLLADLLSSAGAIKISTDLGISGSKVFRPGLDAALKFMREGDVFMVWRLDQAGRSTLNVLHLIASIADRGIGFRSVTEAIDTTTLAGRLLLHSFQPVVQRNARSQSNGRWLDWPQPRHAARSAADRLHLQKSRQSRPR